ncbi:MAG TPA: hypothetical protein VM537_07420 [Anaerolineae bacterium]|nr:hypothetical protein [Anaerolineae bacterium]
MTLRHYRVDGNHYSGMDMDGERWTEEYSAIVVARSKDEAWEIFRRHLGGDYVPSDKSSIASTTVIPRRHGAVEPI